MSIVTLDIRDLSPKSFTRLATYITGELGIQMHESKLTMVQSRLMRRVHELGLRSVDEYAEYFFASCNEDEREQFINAITTNKTDFFRESAHFEYLVRKALPLLVQEKGLFGGQFKVWSAGCSSGEEPYTLAMVLSEYALERPGFDFAILGTDISTKVLNQAQNAIYQESQIVPVPPELRRKYFLRSRNNDYALVRVVPQLRQRLSLHVLNFMDPDYHIKEQFDVVFMRNVLIYFNRAIQESVINKICRHLTPGGYLFVGHSESLSGLNVAVKPIEAAVYRKFPE